MPGGGGAYACPAAQPLVWCLSGEVGRGGSRIGCSVRPSAPKAEQLAASVAACIDGCRCTRDGCSAVAEPVPTEALAKTVVDVSDAAAGALAAVASTVTGALAGALTTTTGLGACGGADDAAAQAVGGIAQPLCWGRAALASTVVAAAAGGGGHVFSCDRAMISCGCNAASGVRCLMRWLASWYGSRF